MHRFILVHPFLYIAYLEHVTLLHWQVQCRVYFSYDKTFFSKLCTNHYKIKREDRCEQHHRRNTHTQTHTQESYTRPAIFFVNREKTIIALSLALQQHSLTAKRQAANDLQPGINVCCSHLIWPWHPGFASVPQLGLSRV